MALAVETVTNYTYIAQNDSRAISIAGASNLLCVCTGVPNTGAQESGVTYGGQALAQVSGSPIKNEGNVCQAYIWYLTNPPTGSNTLAITDIASDRTCVGVISFSGADTSTPFGTLSTQVSDNTTTPTAIVISSATGEIVLDFLAARTLAADTTKSVGADQNERWNIKTGTGTTDSHGGGSTEPGVASTTMSWTSAAVLYWAHGAVAVKPAVTLRSQYLDYDYSR